MNDDGHGPGGDLPLPADEDLSRQGRPDPLEAVVTTQVDRLALLEKVIQLVPVGIGIVELDGRTPLSNEALRRILGWSADELAAMPFTEYSHPADDDENQRLFAQLARGEIDEFAMEKRFITKDGGQLWSALTVTLMRDDTGAPASAIAMIQDISLRRELETKLRAAEKHYRLLVERVPAVVYTAEAGPAGRWHYVSPQIERLLGFTALEWTARPGLWLEQMVEQDRAQALAAEVDVDVSPGAPGTWATYRLRHRDGRIVWVRDAAVARPGRSGVLLHGVLVDVTREKLLEEALASQAIHDQLTGLINRAHFRQQVDHALVLARADASPVAILFIDLDGFKAVNDTLGHGPGDEVLAIVARRLASCAVEGCSLARLGGDEFAMLVTGSWALGLDRLAASLLGSLAEPVSINGRLVRVGASIGGIVGRHGDTTDTLLHHADEAMYRAKEAGGRRFVLDPGPPGPVGPAR